MKFQLVNQSALPVVAAALPKIAEAARLGLARVAADWDLAPPAVAFDPAVSGPPAGWAALYVRDRPSKPEEEGVEGYHDRTADGQPVGYAFEGFVPGGELLRDPGGRGASLAGLVTHELVEMVGDRLADQYRRRNFRDLVSGKTYPWVAEEWCDPVQESALGISIASGEVVDFSNWVKPNWFSPEATSGFDALGLLTAPLSIASGGYVIVGDGEGNDGDVFGRLQVVHHPSPMAAWRAHMKASNPGSRTARRRRSA